MTCPHCNTPISEHPAGQCLDALVAERVMGWRLSRKRTGEPKPGQVALGGGLIGVSVPAYSTDPAAMVELWDHMAQSGAWSDIALLKDRGDDRQACANVHFRGVAKVVFGSTPMLALARAAVLAEAEVR